MPRAGLLRRAKEPSAARASHAGRLKATQSSGASGSFNAERPVPRRSRGCPSVTKRPRTTCAEDRCRPALRRRVRGPPARKSSDCERRTGCPAQRHRKTAAREVSRLPAPRAKAEKRGPAQTSERRGSSAKKNGPFGRLTSRGQSRRRTLEHASRRRKSAGPGENRVAPARLCRQRRQRSKAGKLRGASAFLQGRRPRADSPAAEGNAPFPHAASSWPRLREQIRETGHPSAECQSSTTISLGSITSGRQVGANSFSDSTNRSAFCASTGKVR